MITYVTVLLRRCSAKVFQILVKTVKFYTSSSVTFFLVIPPGVLMESHDLAVTMQANNPKKSPTPNDSLYFLIPSTSEFKMQSHKFE